MGLAMDALHMKNIIQLNLWYNSSICTLIKNTHIINSKTNELRGFNDSLIKPPLINNVWIMTLVEFLKLTPLITLSKHHNWNLKPIFDGVCARIIDFNY
jgi:hypothetical protein